MLSFGAGAANKDASEIWIGTAGGNKQATEGWVGTAGGNKPFYELSGGGGDPEPLSADFAGGEVPPNSLRVVASGGTPPYGYEWAITSGDGSIASGQGTDTCTFDFTFPIAAQCTVTDSASGLVVVGPAGVS